MKLGVNTVLFKGTGVKNAMKAIKAAGYDGVELSAIQGMCEHLVLDAWETQAPLVKAAAKEAGVELLSMEVASLDEERLTKAFKAAQPDVYNAFTRTTTTCRFTISPTAA